MKKKILYIDMDGVVADFEKGINELSPGLKTADHLPGYNSHDEVTAVCVANPNVFHNLKPIENAILSVIALFTHFDIYFLSTPMYEVPESYTGKRVWLEKHLGKYAEKRLILTHRKDLVIGDFLVDDRIKNGVAEFKGKHIHFGTEEFPDWPTTFQYLLHLK